MQSGQGCTRNRRDANFNHAGFSYDPETGAILRGGREVGSSAGRYSIVRDITGNRIAAHRLAWRLQTGSWPQGDIDHINGNKRDNRFSNLREATRSDNMCNAGPQSNSTTGIRGVHFRTSDARWLVKVKKGGLTIHQTASHSLSAVVAARLIRRVLHREFAYEMRGNLREVA